MIGKYNGKDNMKLFISFLAGAFTMYVLLYLWAGYHWLQVLGF